MQVLITGSNGQVGRSIQEIEKPDFLKFIFTDREELNISELSELKTYFSENKVDFLVNCAAYTQVDKAEEEEEKASLINHTAVENLAKLSAQLKIPFIHISSEYVYHPDHELIMKETEKCNPQGVYAKTKLAGDLAAIKHNPKTIILRTSWVYAREGKNFVNTIARLVKEKESLSIVNDQVGSPTYAPDIAEAILSIIKQFEGSENFDKYGVFHFSNEGFISWYEFADEIAKITKSNCLLTPCSSNQYPTPAKRPLNSRISKQKIVSTFKIPIKPWKESLKICLEK